MSVTALSLFSQLSSSRAAALAALVGPLLLAGCGGPKSTGPGQSSPVSQPTEAASDNDGAKLQAAEEKIKAGDYAGAKALLEELRASDPSNAKVAYYLGVSYEGLGDRKQAAALYRAALGSDPKLIEASMNLAAIHLDLRQPKQALEVVEAALKHAPKDPGLLTNRALALFDLGDPEARPAMKRAMEANPNNAGLRLEYARLLAYSKEREEASKVARELLGNDDPKLLMQVAVFFSKLREHAACVEAASKSLDAGIGGSAKVETLVRRGICRVRSGDVEAGRGDFAAAMEADASSPIPHYYDGLALLKQKQPGKAKAAFEKVIEVGGDTPLAQAAKKKLEELE